MRRVAFHTLGCKLNQYDAQTMRQALVKDYRIVSSKERADIYVINTCTVTNRADQKSRQQIRNTIRKNPGAFVVVTGCYVQRRPGEIARIQGVDLILGNREKSMIATLLGSTQKNSTPAVFAGDINSSARYYNTWKVIRHCSHTRAFVKIQEGCENYCSYCIVPYVRGRERNRPLKNILEEISGLIKNGFKEIVLTGIRLGSWGQDLSEGGRQHTVPGRITLAKLLQEVQRLKGLERVRLSSIEPWDLDEELIESIAHLPRVCAHLHLPLQSGDDGILKAMNRPYDTSYYQQLLEKIRKKIEGVAITTDVMAGFPGEGAEEFRNTYSFARKMKFAKMHIFRFSPRPGTSAASLEKKAKEEEVKKRSKKLLALSQEMQFEFNKSFLSRMAKVLVEKKRKDSALTGLSENYIRVAFNGPENLANEIVRVKISEIKQGYVVGKLQ